MTLDVREGRLLKTLEKLSRDGIVLIGGYAVNAYVPPRFSIDCDLVVLGNFKDVESLLKREGFEKVAEGAVSYSNCIRYEMKGIRVSFDLLLNSVIDRETGIAFESDLFKKYSAERNTIGRSVPTRIKMPTADPELLFAMKFVSSRKQDIRDLFMLAGTHLDWKIVRALISSKCKNELITKRATSIRERVGSKNYRDSLQGSYGKIPEQRFETCKKNITSFLREIARD